MAEYIDKEKFIQAMYQESFVKDTDLQKWDSGCWIRYKLFEDVIGKFPDEDVQPVKHGKWLDLWVEDDEIIGGGFMIKQCSVCKEEMYYGEPRYCPDCGAKMDGET